MKIDLGKFHTDLTVLRNPGIMFFFGEIMPFYGRTIQVCQLGMAMMTFLVGISGTISGGIY